MFKTRTWLIIITAIIMISGILTFTISSSRLKSQNVQIIQDGKVIETIDLSKVTRAYTFTIKCESGYNTISVEPGRICVIDADCRDHICMQQGWLSDQATPIVCMPHGLIIQLSDASQTDALTQ
ncbi:MAG: NusG domain II-containing protein [Erysipelotrichaceae bacterium]|nr:NusG domain II-containing protein [Erysipelotrichaceae bacterium]